MGSTPTVRTRTPCPAVLAVFAVLVVGCTGTGGSAEVASPADEGAVVVTPATVSADAAPALSTSTVVDEWEQAPEVVVFGPDDTLEIPTFVEPARGPLPEECPETIWHPQLGTFAVDINHPDDAPDRRSLACAHQSNGTGGRLHASWQTGLGAGWPEMTDRASVADYVVCPRMVCGALPYAVPDFEFGQSEVSLGDRARLTAAIYERTPDDAVALGSTPGRRGFVQVDLELHDVSCMGSWGGSLPTGGIPLAAVELAVDLANLACGAVVGTTSIGAPPTTTTVVAPTFAGVPDEFGLVDVTSASEMTQDEAEYWARAYLGLLADGDYAAAATLLGTPAPSVEERSRELRPLGLDAASDDLDDRLRAWCATDGICLPALDPSPTVYGTDQACFEADGEGCFGFREAWFEPYGEIWRLGFTLPAADGTPLRVLPDSARPENVIIAVGVSDARVFVRGLPPSRTYGDPATRLPQLTVADRAASARFELPGTDTTVELSTDGSELCIRTVEYQAGGGAGGSFGCSGDPAPLAGMMDGGMSGGIGPQDPASFSALVVAADVVVEALDPDGEQRELLARFEAPEVTNGAIWFFAGPFDIARAYEYRTTFTLPDGTTVTQ